MNGDTVKFKVYRYNPESFARAQFSEYQVPFTSGMNVLDGLIYIQKKLDRTLAFRWECRSGICGTCAVMHNGMAVLACVARIDPGVSVNTIEPLANFPVERDLIVDISQALERYKRMRPYLEKVREVKLNKKQADKSKPFRRCIECGCCTAALPAGSNVNSRLDPMSLVKLARFLTDPRDSLDRKRIAHSEGVAGYTKEEGKKLAESCPRRIPIDEAIRLLKATK